MGAFAQSPEIVYRKGTLKLCLSNTSDWIRRAVPIGFNLTFFGNTYSQFYVSANGLVTFNDPDGLYNTEADIPSASAPNNYIAPFWDNLSIMGPGEMLCTEQSGPPEPKMYDPV